MKNYDLSAQLTAHAYFEEYFSMFYLDYVGKSLRWLTSIFAWEWTYKISQREIQRLS